MVSSWLLQSHVFCAAVLMSTSHEDSTHVDDTISIPPSHAPTALQDSEYPYCESTSQTIFIADPRHDIVRTVTLPSNDATSTEKLCIDIMPGEGEGVYQNYRGSEGSLPERPSTKAQFLHAPMKLVTHREKNGLSSIYLVNWGKHSIQRITYNPGAPNTGVQVSPLAGDPNGKSGFNDAFGQEALFARPAGIALKISDDIDKANDDPSFILYVADSGNNRIRKISLSSSGAVLEVTTLSGKGNGYRDGKTIEAQFYSPHGLALSVDGTRLYVADYGNNALREINLFHKEVTTVATRGRKLFPGPTDVQVGADGHIYVACVRSQSIFVISANGEVRALEYTKGVAVVENPRISQKAGNNPYKLYGNNRVLVVYTYQGDIWYIPHEELAQAPLASDAPEMTNTMNPTTKSTTATLTTKSTTTTPKTKQTLATLTTKHTTTTPTTMSTTATPTTKSKIATPTTKSTTTTPKTKPTTTSTTKRIRERTWAQFDLQKRLPETYEQVKEEFLLFPNNTREISHLVILIHGYNSDQYGWAVSMKDKILQRDSRPNLAVLIVDWPEGSSVWFSDSWGSYDRAAANSRYIGESTLRHIEKLQHNGTLDRQVDIHCIGHSIGAHACGFLGKQQQIKAQDGKKIWRITGLDPAGPQFTTKLVDAGKLKYEPIPDTNKTQRLDGTDADLVDVVHTDGMQWGTMESLGRTDFFVGNSTNTLGFKQAGCTGNPCYHSEAWEWFMESIELPGLFKNILKCEVNKPEMRECKVTDAKIDFGYFYNKTTPPGSFGIIVEREKAVEESWGGNAWWDDDDSWADVTSDAPETTITMNLTTTPTTKSTTASTTKRIINKSTTNEVNEVNDQRSQPTHHQATTKSTTTNPTTKSTTASTTEHHQRQRSQRTQAPRNASETTITINATTTTMTKSTTTSTTKGIRNRSPETPDQEAFNLWDLLKQTVDSIILKPIRIIGYYLMLAGGMAIDATNLWKYASYY